MSSRPKRPQSSARPGDIINSTKQKRRSPDKKAADNLSKEQARAAKEKAAVEVRILSETAIY
jgi:hypothetical protein